jgi:alkanesulfonate monooxygenase SsuD/methylene tetrahydromethanopterin reductase-like flavin-dependent oxidoreductase (luciferase family)
MVLNLVTPELAGRLGRSLREEAAAAGRTPPRLATWAVAAVDPTAETRAQLAQGVVPYLGAEGYGEMFTAAGFGELVAAARAGTHPRELLARVPDELAASVGMVGSAEQAARRAAAYREAGVEDLVLVPATAGDDAGARTLRTLRHLGD